MKRSANVWLCATLLSACAGEDATEPAVPVPGIYRLTTVNGAALPFAFAPDTVRVAANILVRIFRVEHGALTLRADGNAELDEVWSEEWALANGAEPGSSTGLVRAVGRWRDAEAVVRFLRDSLLFDGEPTRVMHDTIIYTKARGGTLLVRDYSYQRTSLGNPPPPVNYPFVFRRD